MPSRLLPFLLAACLATVFAGSPPPAVARPAAPDQPEPAYLRLVGALADERWWDLALDGEPIFVDLEFEDVGPYEAINPGTYVVTLTPKGESDPVVKGELTFDEGTDYTLAVTGEPDAVEAVLIVDDNQAPAPGEAHVKFVHLAHDVAAVDVRSGENALFENVSYSETSEIIRLDATTFDFSVHEAGTEPALLTGEGFRVDDGHVYTLFLMKQADGSLSALMATDAVPPGGDAATVWLPALRRP